MKPAICCGIYHHDYVELLDDIWNRYAGVPVIATIADETVSIIGII